MPKDSPEMREYRIRQTLKRHLWVAAVAVEAFRNVRTSAEHYIAAGYNEEHPLHYTFASSIVTTYGKVFIGSVEMPVIHNQFTKFDDANLQVMHDALIVARNNIYAHSDATFEHYQLEVVAIRENREVRLEMLAHGPRLRDIGIPYVKELCDFQLARLKTYRHELIFKLLPLKDVIATLEARQTNSTIIPIAYPKPIDPNLIVPPDEW